MTGGRGPIPCRPTTRDDSASTGLHPGLAYELVLVTPVKKESFMVGEARTVETAVSSTAGDPIKGLSLAPGEIRDLATVRVDDPKQTVGGK